MKEFIKQIDKATESCSSCSYYTETVALRKLVSFSVEDVKEGRVLSSTKLKEKLLVRKVRSDK